MRAEPEQPTKNSIARACLETKTPVGPGNMSRYDLQIGVLELEVPRVDHNTVDPAVCQHAAGAA